MPYLREVLVHISSMAGHLPLRGYIAHLFEELSRAVLVNSKVSLLLKTDSGRALDMLLVGRSLTKTWKVPHLGGPESRGELSAEHGVRRE